jgi:hypothetical protein
VFELLECQVNSFSHLQLDHEEGTRMLWWLLFVLLWLHFGGLKFSICCSSFFLDAIILCHFQTAVKGVNTRGSLELKTQSSYIRIGFRDAFNLTNLTASIRYCTPSSLRSMPHLYTMTCSLFCSIHAWHAMEVKSRTHCKERGWTASTIGEKCPFVFLALWMLFPFFILKFQWVSLK